MALLWLPIGLALPTIIGSLMLRIIEWKSPVLSRSERWILGFVLGTTATMYITFLVHILGLVQFTFWGFLSVQLVLVIALSMLFVMGHRKWSGGGRTKKVNSSSLSPTPCLLKILIILLALWTILKIAAGAALLVGSPPYHDDVFNNWNMRGKLFFETQRLTLTIPLGDEQISNTGVSSYPPTIPMLKTWLATLAGEWNEGLVNASHILWYLSVLALVFLFLRRFTPMLWASLGTYLLASLPLYLIHGSNAYADVFLSFHLLGAVLLLFCAGTSPSRSSALTFMRLFAFVSALLIFTKNESLLLYLPPLFVTAFLILLWLRRKFSLSQRETGLFCLWYVAMNSVILIPWLTFKWVHHLPFGNAKSLSTFEFGWQPGVLHAIAVNTFLEGNWLLLFSLLFITLFWCWRKAFCSPVIILTGFFLMVYLGQIPLYLFTTLSIEVLNQTGYARGLIHLMPIVCVIVTMLIENKCSNQCHPEPDEG